MDLQTLRKRRTELKRNSDITLNKMQKLADESRRVAEVAHNAANYLDDLDLEPVQNLLKMKRIKARENI